MARIRSIKPEFWDDRKLAKRTSRDARLLYIALWNLADEHARLNGDPQWLKGQVFPYDDDIDAGTVAKLIEELETPGLGAVVTYEAHGDPYLFLPKLARHQRLEPEKVASRIPPPPEPRAGQPAQRETRTDPGADSTGPRADETAPRADQTASGAEKPALLYGAGSMEHVAGSRGAARGPDRAARDPAPRPPDSSGLHELPDDFQITDALRRWAHKTYPGLDLDFETDQFCRHYRSTGQRRKSWPDAWQKWIADSHKRAAQMTRASPRQMTKSPDDQLADALRRIDAREERFSDTPGNGTPRPVHQISLPSAGD